MDEDFHEQRSTSASADQGEAFVRLLLEHEPQVRSFLRGLLPTWNDVDEVIQEASLIAWRKFSDFEQGTAFGGWFLTIARFEALKHRRRIARTPLVFSNDVKTLRIGPAEIGNWGQPLRESPWFAVRNLNGAVDELAIFNAALDWDEIRTLYEQGKPFGY